jgi:hypothetical protein
MATSMPNAAYNVLNRKAPSPLYEAVLLARYLSYPYRQGSLLMLQCCSLQDFASRYVTFVRNHHLKTFGPVFNSLRAMHSLTVYSDIKAILSLVFTWDKILEINWKRRREVENLNEPVEGANVTVGELKGINSVVRMFLSVVEIPVFGGAVIAILAIGEANFFSPQVRYQTEPMASIGKLLHQLSAHFQILISDRSVGTHCRYSLGSTWLTVSFVV